MTSQTKGALIASAVAALFSAGCATTAPAMQKTASNMVHCGGVNQCKGMGSCAGADNACKSRNTCKGKGWVETTRDDCTAKGGQILASSM